MLCIGCKILCNNAVNGKLHTHALGLCFPKQFARRFNTFLIKIGCADIKSHSLEECITHCAADKQSVAFVEQISDNADLVADLFAAENRNKGTRRICKRTAHYGKLLFNQETANGGQIMRNALG